MTSHAAFDVAVIGGGPAGAQEIRAKLVINAAGRWSRLREKPQQAAAKWIGLKAHFKGADASAGEAAAVELYFLNFGYCGVQPVISEGEQRWNVCAMVR